MTPVLPSASQSETVDDTDESTNDVSDTVESADSVDNADTADISDLPADVEPPEEPGVTGNAESSGETESPGGVDSSGNSGNSGSSDGANQPEPSSPSEKPGSTSEPTESGNQTGTGGQGGNGTTGEPEQPVLPGLPELPPPDGGPVILTIFGDGAARVTEWSLGQLKALHDGYREIVYSTTNNWPTFSFTAASGVSVQFLLRQAGLKSNATAFKFTATDGYTITVPYSQVFGLSYTFETHSATGSSGASKAEPLISWEWGAPGKTRPENIRVFFGQRGPMEVNAAAFVQNLCSIEVLTASTGAWQTSAPSIANGSEVARYTELRFTHDDMDNIRIYYTIDGSTPDYNSLVYNRSTSYFQPHLISPVVLTESVTIKAFASGLGREDSDVVMYTYTVK